MGLHPETDGYFTKPECGFEWIQDLPELPQWILDGIINKNVRQGKPTEERTRMVGPSFAINQRIGVERDMALAKEAMWSLPQEAVDDYDIWIMVGQSLHELDESLLDDWDDWSRQSDKYKPGECQRRWQSFSKNGGVTIGSLIHTAKENGWKPDNSEIALGVDNRTLDHVAEILLEMEDVMKAPPELVPMQTTWFDKGKGEEEEVKPEVDEQRKKNAPADEVTKVLLQLYKGNIRYSTTASAFFSMAIALRGYGLN